MTDDAGAKLLAAVEALMGEVRGLRADLVSRDDRETSELAGLREQAADLAGIRSRAASRRKRNRQEKRERDSRETSGKLPKSHDTMSQDSRATGDYRGKAVSSTTPEKQKQEPLTPLSQDSRATPKERVWAFWQSHLGKASTAKFDRKRQRAVDGRLRDGYTVDQLCDAIRGCKADPFSMGQNDRHQRYDDISLICRDAEHVDKFVALAPKSGPSSNGVHRLPAWEERALEEEALMAKHGIGRPA